MNGENEENERYEKFISGKNISFRVIFLILFHIDDEFNSMEFFFSKLQFPKNRMERGKRGRRRREEKQKSWVYVWQI